jgi:hypothetical protein
MKWLFFGGALLLILFEAANVYFIMPLPYSQRARSIDLAYFLYSWRWALRALFGALMLAGVAGAWRPRGWRKLLVAVTLVVVAGVVYATNFVMSADHIFREPASVVMRNSEQNIVEPSRLVVGVDVNGEARAYPIQFIGYHHQVRDVVGGTPILVTFCTVCRTGRVFAPVVDGEAENFRLVGMDHFNAMFEDRTTGSWWRQATGEAIAGPRKGKSLPEIASRQVTLAQWLSLHPASLIMQPDSASQDRYSASFDYETGASRRALTGTDTISWRDKAWVIGVSLNGESKAYDWKQLRHERAVNDVVGGTPIVIALASDSVSFFAFERPAATMQFDMRGDSLVTAGRAYALSGRGTTDALKPVFASQEFWHSWRTFHPGTKR